MDWVACLLVFRKLFHSLLLFEIPQHGCTAFPHASDAKAKIVHRSCSKASKLA